MKDAFFSENFFFNTFSYGNNSYTDNRIGSPHHYLAYMEKGTSKIVSNDITIEINAGELFFIPKGLPYQSYWKSEHGVKFKSFGFEYFPEFEHKQYVLQKINCDDILKSRIINIPTHKNISSFLLGEFYSVLNGILPFLEYQNKNPKKQIIEKAKKYIFKNTDCKISDVAKHCLLSESALYNLFKKELGITPNEMRQKILCDNAVLMLTTTEKSIQEISDTLGFSSTSYFRKIMFRHTGKTPREIRKNSLSI